MSIELNINILLSVALIKYFLSKSLSFPDLIRLTNRLTTRKCISALFEKILQRIPETILT
ncbi:hypothetical protein [Flavobacterium sp. GP15]|uniref:hypothetical protein n=1 Tax=Flavobacterium sp. GP15 TaxID=2758567 RepID=UPI00165DB713|nr:hypothetical protein [Flavobacterium sp. GP15]